MRKVKENYLLHISLFILTFITCSIAGTQWAYKDFLEVSNWHHGTTYAILILTFLSAHEFGHYFAAKYHGVSSTLPYYIPQPIPIVLNFGTFGAVIKTRSPIPTRIALFDIGAAGPIAGFLVCMVFLIYGLQTLPTIDFIYKIHPNYITEFGGKIPANSLHFGDTLLYSLLSKYFASPTGFLPPMNEIYHYPFLCVGWFGLFVTALNLLPIGQLDGGHIIYSMFGKKHINIASYIWWIIFIIGLSGLLAEIYNFFNADYDNRYFYYIKDIIFPTLSWIKANAPWLMKGWAGWLFWALVTRFFIKLRHPPIEDDTELDNNRKLIGWFTMAILIFCFSLNGIYFIE